MATKRENVVKCTREVGTIIAKDRLTKGNYEEFKLKWIDHALSALAESRYNAIKDTLPAEITVSQAKEALRQGILNGFYEIEIEDTQKGEKLTVVETEIGKSARAAGIISDSKP